MSTSSLRSLSSRAGGGLGRNLPAHPSPSAYGRTAAYRRIAGDCRQYSEVSIRRRQYAPATIQHPLALRSHFLPHTIPASAASVRQVSFKELREQRAKERAGEAQPEQPKRPGQQQKKPEPEPEPKKQEPSAADEAEAAFAKTRAESEREWARQEEQFKKEEEEAKETGEGQEGEQQRKQKKKDDAAPPPHGTKTPWQVFTETLQAEFKANKEWEESTKQLSGTMHDFSQNPNVVRARSAYAKAAEAASTTTGKAFLGTAGAIGKGAAWTWNTPVAKGIRYGAGAMGSGMERVTRPMRETEAYKSVKDTIDDGASQRYGGWTEKEERRRRREEREKKMGTYKAPEVFTEDPNAGTNVTLHKDSAWKESWKNFRDNSPVMQRFFGLGSTYRESENPLISTARSISDRVAGFFAENETAQVIKKFREMDPSFQLEPFLNEMRTYILPEVLEAYVQGDVETLKLWLSAAQFQVYSALMHQYTTAGLQSDGKILDIRGVDVLSARMLDPGEIPVFVIMCRTQEVHVYRKKKTGELAAGMEDKVQQVTYAIGVTRIPEDVSNPETRGWKLIELQKSGRDYI
ncbi:TIM44 subunit of mitochondria import inner membrane translocase [Hortaea werneckii]|uniref:Mitochondrial import inner membrane translocase subunit TIM44 n=1 Tax=Hortaea werneckii TaxID=91943 RepID=A0A3M7JCK7_HORWE|nr:TIM44 subunit of mitochondria import inner membrane translocase [Hortaea werneckii]KAI7252768.1 TIM44 subunit of mitochondria import inner membrane translocase [Hortaea werneckii]KAI7380006.1 TIM44 subunit of mitochondria import inner membrane translocase [Hortaea werneckii]KAI7388059.1 TIM44 subunit of mitochondria import inner membrane translocase [Hortaea werneckii]KAI7428413.1 TIM44 subunit of mitochondria import inner membrane translocase [Hortaea werneckii]